MPHIHAIDAARSLHRPMVDRERHRIALEQRHDFGTRLHSWALFGEYKLTAGEVSCWFREQKCHLNRKHMFSVKVLVETVEIARPVLEKQRSGAGLAGRVAPLR